MSKVKEEPIKTQGTVLEAVKGKFKVKLDEGGHELLAHLGGKMRLNYIRIVPGDRVTLEISPYDLTKARIIFREK